MSSSSLQRVGMLKPKLHGSELKSVSFYRLRNPTVRLDVAPFYFIYPTVILAVLGGAVTGNGCETDLLLQLHNLIGLVCKNPFSVNESLDL